MAPSAAPPLASVIDDNNLLQLMQIDAYLAQLNKQLCDGVPRNARDALDMAGKLPLALKTHSIVMWSLAPHPPRARWPALMLFRARLPSPLTGRAHTVHLRNSHVFGAAAIAEGTDVRRHCLRPRAGGAPLPAPCAQRAARAGDGHQGQGAKGKSEGRVSRGAPGRAQPRCCLMHRMARPWQGADPRGGGGQDLEIEASSQPFNVPAPNTLSS